VKVAGKLTTIEILLLAAATLFLAAVGAQYIHTARRAADVPWEIVTGRGDVAALTPGEPELLDLNTATAEQLQTLPGIGQVLAGRIVEHRQAQGPYASVEELLSVEGIGEVRLEALREYITIETQTYGGTDDAGETKP